MRLVLDTNVLIAAVVADGVCRDLVRMRLRSHTLITSEILLRELRNKLRNKLRVKFDLAAADLPLLDALSERAEIVKPAKLAPPICRDPDDDWVLATALAGRADFIITGDNDLTRNPMLERMELLGGWMPRGLRQRSRYRVVIPARRLNPLGANPRKQVRREQLRFSGLIDIKKHGAIRILSPRAFLEFLDLQV